MPINFNNADLTFIFGASNLQKAQERLKEYQQKNGPNNCDDYKFLDELSRGRGTEAFQKLSNYRMRSTEYYSAFDFFKKNKTLNLDDPKGLEMHVYRNKNMYKKAPHDLQTMRLFVKLGYFIEEGYSPCHNIPANSDNEEFRMKTLQEVLYLVRHGGMISKNKYAAIGNISFRGRAKSSFEGCQFVYNEKTGKLVVDNVNRGTYNYGKYGTPAHFFYDIAPWAHVGNGDNVEKEELFIMEPEEEKRYLENKLVISKVDLIAEQKAESDAYNVFSYCLKFLTDTIKHGFGKSAEDVVPGEDFLNIELERVKQTRSAYINDYIHRNVEKLLNKYEPDWNNYVQLINRIMNAPAMLFKNIVTYVDYIETDPANLLDMIEPENKLSFFESLMETVLTSVSPDEIKEGTKVGYNIPMNFRVRLNPKWIETLSNIDHDKAITVYRNVINEIQDEFNDVCKDIGVSFRVLTDNTDNSFEYVDYSIKLDHTISKEEAIVCGQKSVQKPIIRSDSIESFVLPKIEFDNMLNEYHEPEYLRR